MHDQDRFHASSIQVPGRFHAGSMHDPDRLREICALMLRCGFHDEKKEITYMCLYHSLSDVSSHLI